MSKMYNVRIPDELDFKVEECSKLTDRSRSYIVKKALEAYIEDYADYKEAMKRLMDKKDKTVSMKKMKQMFGL